MINTTSSYETTSSETSSALEALISTLTTPFIQPSGCDSIFSTTSVFETDYDYSGGRYVTGTIEVAISDRNDPKFTSCQPSRWADVVYESQFSFSPAVCPGGWTAYELREAGVRTAFCCQSGYVYASGPANVPGVALGNGCYSEIGVTPATTTSISTSTSRSRSPASAVPTVTETTATTTPRRYKVHNAYHISWGASDMPALSPQPPDLASCSHDGEKVIPTWVPGDPNPVVECINQTDGWGGGRNSSLYLFLIIGLPIVIGLCIICCCACCCRHSIKEKRANQAKTARAGRVAEETGVPLAERLVERSGQVPVDEEHEGHSAPPPYRDQGQRPPPYQPSS
ncbi:hypothetical protein B0T25DRAFT_573208 [Lasiosphaeria hispida]|uniref:Uncharacterized protein n=1 Tax=Lasiosphaeria hispida TaxID=260671 RepID=A0AAJ0H9I4_9PEZI|nr:hypothetical protein B0T25DRAFT_573208 [Lasiosphaeria hispida]